jgi:hypothetical protein
LAIDEMLSLRLPEPSATWLTRTCEQITGGVSNTQFASLLSIASRYTPREDLRPTCAERQHAGEALEGWNPERWKLLEMVRVAMILAHPALCSDGPADALEETFRHADMGELGALYRGLALLPHPKRFLWRATEGCRTNIRPVFEAIACDNPYPALHFDDTAWNQLVIKAIFVEAPVWRIVGLDSRLSLELSRMVVDLVEEKRSAGRKIPPLLWLCLGEHPGERGLAQLQKELSGAEPSGRRAAILALARAGAWQQLEAIEASEIEAEVSETLRLALDGQCDQTAFAELGDA